jgi:hypothetical protein
MTRDDLPMIHAPTARPDNDRVSLLGRMAPEAVLAIHFVWVLFAVFGGFLGFSDLGWLWLHAPAVIWSAVVNFAGWTCPLTPLEKELRRRASISGYEGGFVEHYIAPLVYPGGMPRRMELIAGFSITAWNALVYGLIAVTRP